MTTETLPGAPHGTLEGPDTIESLLAGRGYPAEAVDTVLRERLLTPGLVRRLHALWPEHSRLHRTAAPLFVDGRHSYAGLDGLREVCDRLAERGVELGHRTERELFVDVYRFLVTRHTLNLIDWERFADDPIFHLVFSQPGIADGDLANWSTGALDAIPAVGGAMDLVAGVPTVLVVTHHVTRGGEPKIVERCTYPLTARRVVSRIYTDLAVLDPSPDGLALVETAPGVSLDEVRAKTGAPLATGAT